MKPAKEIMVSDTIGVRIGEIERTVVVASLADRRGSATVAATLYSETPESIASREQAARDRRLAHPLGADMGPRPTKQARRQIEALRRSQRGQRKGAVRAFLRRY